MRSDALRRIVPAALLAMSFPVLLAGLLGLTAPLWLPLLLTVLSALFHLCDLPHFFKGERRHMAIFVHNDHPVFLCS